MAEFPGKVGACALCPGRGKGRFKSSKHGGLIRHVAMAHGKVDEYMRDEAIVKAKRKEELGDSTAVNDEGLNSSPIKEETDSSEVKEPEPAEEPDSSLVTVKEEEDILTAEAAEEPDSSLVTVKEEEDILTAEPAEEPDSSLVTVKEEEDICTEATDLNAVSCDDFKPETEEELESNGHSEELNSSSRQESKSRHEEMEEYKPQVEESEGQSLSIKRSRSSSRGEELNSLSPRKRGRHSQREEEDSSLESPRKSGRKGHKSGEEESESPRKSGRKSHRK